GQPRAPRTADIARVAQHLDGAVLVEVDRVAAPAGVDGGEREVRLFRPVTGNPRRLTVGPPDEIVLEEAQLRGAVRLLGADLAVELALGARGVAIATELGAVEFGHVGLATEPHGVLLEVVSLILQT